MLGQVTPVALGHTTGRIELDFETYSGGGYVWNADLQRWDGPPRAPKGSKGLPVIGAYNSILHETFEIVWLAYDLKDGAGVKQWRPGLPPPEDLFAAILRGEALEAWNASYERWVWELYCVPRLGWPAVQDHQWHCAMAKARAFALPGKLSEAGRVIGAGVRKDANGDALMKRLSMPINPTKATLRTRVLPVYDAATRVAAEITLTNALLQAEPGATPKRAATIARHVRRVVEEDAQDTAAYGRYNATDVLAEADIAARVPDQPPEELAWWRVHERINRRGAYIDRAGVLDCIAVVEQAFVRYNRELRDICGVDAASKVAQLQTWLESRGHRLDSLDEEHVAEALTRPLLPPDVRRVLEIRAAVGSASIKKLFAMLNRLSPDSRLRDLYVYHGARTGRSTGEGPQPTNLPKAGPDLVPCECGKFFGAHHAACPFCSRPVAAKPAEWNPAMAEQALDDMRRRSLDWIEYVYGSALPVIAGCLRALYAAAPGHDLISTDYNSIEAVGLAMLAGEVWRKKVFATHGKIYEASASTAFRVPLEDILGHKKQTGQHHPLRQKGKGLELACLAPDVGVMTDSGAKRLDEVTTEDRVWDGVEWVKHQGLVFRGVKQVVALAGARMTPDHKVLCGRFWREASELVSNERTLCLSLATATDPSPSSRPSGPGTRCGYESSATAGAPRTPCCSPTSSTAERSGATSAPSGRPRRSCAPTGGTTRSSPTTPCASGCCPGCPPRSGDATTPGTPTTSTTGCAASPCTTAGETTGPSSCGTSSPCPGGTIRPLKWTEQTSIAGTSQGTSGSSRDASTPPTAEESPTWSSASATWSAVFDIAHAGPRNRFTIMTDRGPLIVHNCGYQGWVGAAKAFDIPGTDDEIGRDILAWRAASPAIEWLWGGQEVRKAASTVRNALQPGYEGTVADWALPLVDAPRYDRSPYYYGVEGMAILAALQPGQWNHVFRMDGTDSGIAFLAIGTTLFCRIPSGRLLTYHNVVLEASDRGGYAMSYEGWNTNPKNGPVGQWIRMRSWGGRLVENINQAVCRDILAPACIALEARWYPVVLHVYDEIVAEVPEGFGSVEEFESIVTVPPPWAHDWPIRAPGGYRAKRYRKG